jgi:predicted dehydrogenase
VADVIPARREAAARRLPGARIYSSHRELLAAETALDALIVTTPPAFHAGAVVDGLRAGLHVLCEKPLTLDSDAFSSIRAEAVRAGRAAYCVNNWAYSPQWSRLLEAAASGLLGALRHVDIRVLRTKPSASALPGDWRKDPEIAGGGIFVDHGWHNFYLLRRLLGAGTRLVSVVLSPTTGADEVATALFAAPGATGTVHLSWKSSQRSNGAAVIGEKGIAELFDDRLVIQAGGVEDDVRFPEKLSAGSAHPAWLAAMWPAFEAECAGRGRGESLAESEFCLRTIREAYRERETARA